MTSRSRYRALLLGILAFVFTATALHAQQPPSYRFAVSFPSAAKRRTTRRPPAADPLHRSLRRTAPANQQLGAHAK